MARGFLSGVLWGGILSVVVGSFASVLAPPPMAPEVGDAAPGVAEAPLRITEADSGEQGSDGDRAPITGQSVAQTTAPDPDTIAGIDADTLTSAAVPETGGTVDLQTPSVATDTQNALPQGDEPVLPNPQALAPMEPNAADQLSISTEPAQPPAPQTDSVQGAFDAPAQPSAEDVTVPETTDLGAAGDDSSDNAATDDSATDSTERAATAVAPAPEDPVDPTVPEPAIAPVAPPAIVLDDAPEVAPEAETEVAPETETRSETASARPTIGTPAVSLTERGGGVTVNRLTSTQTTNSQTAQVAIPTEAPTEAASDDGVLRIDGNLKPITAFGQEFENPDDKPLMGIVLIDEGTSPISGNAGMAALRSFPYPLSFAVDSSLPDAADRMTLYRKEGFEVLAMVDLPEGATPVDAETTFGVILAKLPEVVGVLEGTSGGLQGAREVADQVTAILAGSGHGLITQDKGLNTMPKLARKEGVPADPVFRDFDSKGQNAQVIRRFLDQAAFRAGQEGAVIMLGRLRPDTISALLLWGLQDRVGQVALAPISAVLLRE